MTDTVDFSYLSHLDELRALGVPDSISRDAVTALEAFWGGFNTSYPEVTTGDTEMCDEPVNAMILWLCEHAGINVDASQLTVQDICLPHGTDDSRFNAALQYSIDAVKTALRSSYRNLRQPSYEIHKQLRFIMSTHLRFNYPRAKDVQDN